MLRHMFDELRWLFREHRGPGHERYYFTQMIRSAMNRDALSIDPRGEWSPRKAQRVLEIINEQARAYRLIFSAVEVTTHNMPYRRMILVPQCLEHGISVGEDEICRRCILHVKK
jgi:hypothetical protein